ncbi:MAG TPA: hypothetical protein VFQ93_01080 [Casimicrobiaceae bacterium]|nr:hypothetical protein [Casimicrobiaceae bacterium]
MSSQSLVETVVTLAAALLLTFAGYEMLTGVSADSALMQAVAATHHGA